MFPKKCDTIYTQENGDRENVEEKINDSFARIDHLSRMSINSSRLSALKRVFVDEIRQEQRR